MLPAQNPTIPLAATAHVDGDIRPIRRRLRLRHLAIMALGAVAALSLAAPASADPFGLDQPTNNVPGVGAIPDNFNHTYCFDGAGWSTARRAVVNTQMANLDTQTSYFDTFPIPTGCFPTTDLAFQVTTLPPGVRGDWRCQLWNNGVDGVPNSGDDRCEGAIIRISSSAVVLPDDHQRRKTTCHEIGHSVGLAHGTTSDFWTDCMRSGAVPAGIQWERYNAHHIAHANSRTPSAS